MSDYYDALCEAMTRLGMLPNTIFVGQGVGCAGTSMTDTLKGVPQEKLLEFPVAEDLQMGFCIGLALDGWLPICIFPRWNFLICATNQLVNHLDKLPIYSGGGYKPVVIIRTSAPSNYPFDPGPQHSDDFTDEFSSMLRTVNVQRLMWAPGIVAEYERAAASRSPTLLVEYPEFYSVVPSGVPQTM